MPPMESPRQNSMTLGGFDNAQRARYLGIIDQFRELGVNESISLPQLVVIGDQSSGKSSLLEGLTGLAFPVAGELCTRFATQIVLRRDDQVSSRAKVTIIPGPTSMRDENVAAHLQSFEHFVDGDELEEEEFTNILNAASIHMGLPGIIKESEIDDDDADAIAVADTIPAKRFFDDILRVELTGPDQTHLSVVDVPGLFHNPTKYQTEHDKEVIRALINGYIVEDSTIIMAVMDARNNLATQEVFDLARRVDGTRERTVGILTKLDLVALGDERPVLSVLQNQVENLRHGWFAVRNRSTKNINDGVTIAQRHEVERALFRDQKPWNTLDPSRCGIESLKKFLGQLLYEHVQREFPSLVKKVEAFYAETQILLDKMGPSCQTTFEKRQFLTSIATSYQLRARDALLGNYEPNLPSDDVSKLRKHFRDRSDRLSYDMSTEGHSFDFLSSNDTFRAPESDRSGKDDVVEPSLNHPTFMMILQTYTDSRGSELPGLVSPSVVENLFRQQSCKWDSLAQQYFEDVLAISETFRQKELCQYFADAAMRHRVEACLSFEIQNTVNEGRQRLRQILEDERAGVLQTQDPYLADEINKTQQKRLAARLETIGLGYQMAKHTKLAEVLHAAHLSLEEHAVYSIHDVLKAYYKLARKRFTDNVTMAVAERFLLGERGPVKAFTVDYITRMSDEELDLVAAEAFSVSHRRNELKQRVERLQKALALSRIR